MVHRTVSYIFKDYMPSKVGRFTSERDTARGQANINNVLANVQEEVGNLRTYMHHQMGVNSDSMNLQIT